MGCQTSSHKESLWSGTEKQKDHVRHNAGTVLHMEVFITAIYIFSLDTSVCEGDKI